MRSGPFSHPRSSLLGRGWQRRPRSCCCRLRRRPSHWHGSRPEIRSDFAHQALGMQREVERRQSFSSSTVFRRGVKSRGKPFDGGAELQFQIFPGGGIETAVAAGGTLRPGGGDRSSWVSTAWNSAQKASICSSRESSHDSTSAISGISDWGSGQGSEIMGSPFVRLGQCLGRLAALRVEWIEWGLCSGRASR